MAQIKFLTDEWQAVSRRLDEALALAPAEQAAWLAALDAGDDSAAVKQQLRELLPADGVVETADFLASLPRLNLAPQSAEPDPGAPVPGATVGPYRLLRELGVGGMGAVWLAERSDGSLKRSVALKLPRLSWSGNLADRLKHERDILASLDHPHIAHIYDAGVDALGRPYLALEYVQGEAIDAYCRSRALPTRARLTLLLQVAQAVSHAHARLVVHRDLKPANILVTPEGQVRLLDFGIAKLLDGASTGAGEGMGAYAADSTLTRQAGRALTPDYASPEQICGAAIGTASDVYSLGVVAYELLTGARPYHLHGSGDVALERALRTVQVKPASTAATDPLARQALRGDLDAILNKALKLDLSERTASIDALAQDIERHLANQPVRARPDSPGYRLRKFTRRNGLAVAAAGSVTLAVLGGAGVAMWQAAEAREQARLANLQTERARTETQRAEAVQGFLLDIFKTNSDQQADPLRARNSTALQLLDIGAARLDASLKDAPEAREKIMGTLAEMYYQLQLEEKAAVIERQRIDLLKKLHGTGDRRVAEALIGFAASLHSTKRREEILPVLEEARAILDGLGDRTSSLRGALWTRLAQRHHSLSYEKMKLYADEAVSVLRPLAVNKDSGLDTALVMAGRARAQLGEMAGAETAFREALVVMGRSEPVSQVALLQTRVSLAECLAAQQKFDAAMQLYRDTVQEGSARLGPLDPGALAAQSRLAVLLHATGQRTAGRLMHSATLAQVLQSRGADDTLFTMIVKMDYGRSLLAEGRLAQSMALVAAVNASNRRHYAGSALLGNGLRREATLWTAQGDFIRARQLLVEGWDHWQRGGGHAMHPSRHNTFHLDTARLDLAQGDARAALAVLDRVVAPHADNPLPLAAEEIERDVLRSHAHQQLGATARALELAQAAHTRMAAAATRAFHPALDAEVSLQWGQALLQAGRAAQAREPIALALAWRLANDDPGSPWLGEAHVAQARYWLSLNDRGRARAEVDKARAVLTSNKAVGEQFLRPLREVQRALKSG